jgi:hypothetical protein
MALDMEARQKKGEEATSKELENLRSLILVIDSIAECMVPEHREKENKKVKNKKILSE